MAQIIEITVEDDGTFTVDAETKEAEAAEQEPTGNEQKFKTADEALAAAKQLLDAASMAPPAGGDQGAEPETPAESAASGEEEDQAMSQSFQPRR